ncbi:MAG: hypothetical protein PVS3B1_23250 [Ktedonobacteraceae bacterium]
MFQGYYNQQEEQGFPWQQEGHHHGQHGHHGHHFGGPRGQFGPGFEGPRGPWAQGQFGPGFGGPRGPWAQEQFGPGFGGPRGHHGPHFGGPRGGFGLGFGGPRGPWARGRGQFGSGFGGPRGPWAQGRPEITAEQQVLRSTAGEVVRLFFIAARKAMGSAEGQSQLKSFLEGTRERLQALVGEPKAAAQSEGQQPEQPNVEQA